MTAIATNPNQGYAQSLQRATQVNWRVEDIIGGDKKLDFTTRFLPDALAQVNEISCLNTEEKQLLNQIRGNSYLHLFGLVEEFIVPTVINHVNSTGLADITATQALLHFAEEESKHIRLFRRFAEEFEIGFGGRCDGIGPVQEIANAVLQHRPLGVALIILYIEWMTQYHYLASVRDNVGENLDPQFCSLLKHHWLEEAQHTTLDTLMVNQLVSELEPAEVEAGVEDFFKLIEFLDGGLMMQVQLDLAALSAATGRTFTEAEQQEIQTIQKRSYRWTFIGSGISHAKFVQTFAHVSPASQSRLAEVAKKYS
ncbi:hypothetical protein H6G89_31635 [Oscillatoria sp. FACHB-1407]|uniref:hypothetical protein n=1 Tax=Oscillatoria sp. FACHB-1407 TaxID=2692847 RepID=UPI001688B094|nr:hypothetical protein [Oscillatoria sp. FACHB-1407]MBD2465547.1 hypothetical protein [Oscillatoria sp. FACHB-1407]